MKRIENQNKMAAKRKASSDSVKHASLTGYSEETTPLILTKMKQHPHNGDWRRDKKIRIPYKTCTITWSCSDEGAPDPFLIKTPVPIGMPGLMEKNQSVLGKSFESVTAAVRNHFELEKKESFQSSKFSVTLPFSGKSIYKVLVPIDMPQCHI